MRTRGPSRTNAHGHRDLLSLFTIQKSRSGGWVRTSNSPSAFIHCWNTARQASLRLAFCRRKQAVMARTFGISPAQSR
jgi:hypothetical protein